MPNYCSIITYRTVLKWMTKTKTKTKTSINPDATSTVATTGTN